MDNNERRRRPSSGQRSTQERRRRSSGTGRSSAATKETRRRAEVRTRQRTTAQPQRAVRPPKEEIPDVVYTAPKPLHRGRFLLRLVSVVAVVMAIMMCLSVFFRVEEVNVSGAEQYTPWMVLEASGIQKGESLLGLSKAKAASKIRSQLQYVDEVRIGIKLPGTVNIEIKELEVVYAIQASDNTWWLISSDGDVVEQVDAASAGTYTQVLGVWVEAPRANQSVQAAQTTVTEPAETTEPDATGETQETVTAETEQTDPVEPTALTEEPVPSEPVTDQESAQRLQAALTILQELEDSGVIGKVTTVDVSDLTKLTLEYGDRIHVVLGDTQRLSYKISYMAQAVQQLEAYETGTLDVSFEYYDEALFEPAE